MASLESPNSHSDTYPRSLAKATSSDPFDSSSSLTASISSTYPRSCAKISTSSSFSDQSSKLEMEAIVLQAPRKWQKGSLLGSGAFGSVYRALDTETGAELAIKQVELHCDTSDARSAKEVQALEDEMNLLKNLHHLRIVQYYGMEVTDSCLTIFMEYVSGRSIFARLRDYGPFTEDVVRKYTRQILEGLEYLHENRIIHRDIKGANVLVDAKGSIKLADFGASKQLPTLKTMTGIRSVHGTPYWMSPEVINGQGYGRKSDIWSVGCTTVEMITGRPPLSECEPMAALFRIGQPSTDFTQFIPKNISREGVTFLSQCFQRDVMQRPSAGELLKTSKFVAEL